MPKLTLTKKPSGPIVGLDIEAGSIAATEVSVNGSARVTASAVGPLEAGAFHEGEVIDAGRLASGLKAFFAEHKLGKRVRLGIGNQRLVVRTMQLPALEDPKEMDAAIRFQAQEQMPMPLDQAVLEHQVVGGVTAEEGGSPKVDVVVVAARREMITSFLEPLRRAGLEPVGVDLNAFGMIRALAGVEATPATDEDPANGAAAAAGAVLYCNLGDLANLAVARGRACLFTRVSSVGLDSIASQLSAERGLTMAHAQQWLSYVGLEEPVERLEGDAEIVAAARRALEGGLAALLDELRLTLDYYGAQEGAVSVGSIVLCGPGSAIAGFSARMESSLSLPVSTARPAALGDFDAPVAARLTIPFGLALEQ